MNKSIAGGLACLLLSSSAQALVLEKGDDEQNAKAPKDDPGWSYVGSAADCPGTCPPGSYVYLGRGWVITALSVEPAAVRFESEGPVHQLVAGSAVQVGGRRSNSHLQLFRIEPPPELAELRISSKSPLPEARVMLIGTGQGRGPRPQDPKLSNRGWTAADPAIKRWGTNRVDRTNLGYKTKGFSVRFEHGSHPRVTEYEAQATRGDVGGAVFSKQDGAWVLSGLILDTTNAYYGAGKTIIVDLSHYREKIQKVIQASDTP